MSTTSTNLHQLKRLGLVEARREGTTVHYRLGGDDVAALIVTLSDVAAQRYAPVREMRSRACTRHLPPSAGQALEEPETYVVLDVRPVEEFEAGHLPGAWSVPLADLTSRAEELPRDRTVLLYCRGEFCTLAEAGATLLRDRGFDAHAVDEGVIEWRAAGAVVLDVDA